MKIGVVGLGKMGLNLALNMKTKGYEVIGYDISEDVLYYAINNGIEVKFTPSDLAKGLCVPKVLWLMLPSYGNAVDEAIKTFFPLLEEGDIVVDAGNSDYRETQRRYQYLKSKGIRFADIGVSGGLEGARNGICAMVGADRDVFEYLEPLLKDICVEGGYLHTGPCGSGHYVKMIHNGIEYAMMQAIGEGMELLAEGPFELNLEAIAGLWCHGSIIRGWLMELTQRILAADPELQGISDVIQHTGEGLWTVREALEREIPIPVISGSLMVRFRSLQKESFSGKIVAALRREFGGHLPPKKDA